MSRDIDRTVVLMHHFVLSVKYAKQTVTSSIQLNCPQQVKTKEKYFWIIFKNTYQDLNFIINKKGGSAKHS